MHLDLKYENIFVNDENELMIGDFGHSRFIEKSDMKRKCYVGTSGYNSPEQLTKYYNSPVRIKLSFTFNI